MSAKTILTTTAQLNPQIVQDTLTGREAMELVRDWVGSYFDVSANVRSWTPYWKEVLLHRPGNILIAFRFRLGGPVLVSQSVGWSISQAEQATFEQALLPFLDELGQALAQQRIADAIQSQYPNASRVVRDDDTILIQLQPPAPTASLGETSSQPDQIAIIIHANQIISIFSRCANESAGRAAVRRFLADLQVAGVSVVKVAPISSPR